MSIPELGRRNSVSFSTPVKQGSSVLYLLGCAEEPTFLQFYTGMLKDVIHLLCIYSCIGSEVLRAIFPFTLLDL